MMKHERNPHGQREQSLLPQSPADATGISTVCWKLTLMAGTALALMCSHALADGGDAQGRVVNTQLAQSKDDEEKKNDAIMLAPISIDAKADVITGGVQLDSDDIERIQPQTLRDVFRQEPSVKVGSPVPISQKIYVNGIEDTNLNVDIDGARQANKTYHHVGTTIIDPGLFKAVKVESGVAPADAGPRAMAGSISLETRDGRDLVAPGSTFGGFTSVAYNSSARGFSEQAAGAAKAAGVDVMLYGAHAGGGDYVDGAGDRVFGTRPDNTNFIGKIGYAAPNGYRIKLSGTRYDDISVRDGRPNFGFTGTTFVDYSRQQTTFSFGDETPTDMWDPVLSMSRTYTHMDVDFGTTFIKAWVESYNGKAQNTFTTDLGKITTGVDFFHDIGKGARTAGGGGPDGKQRRETERDYGVFAQARLAPLETLRTSFGGRYDFHRLEGNDGTKLSNNGASGNANVEYDVTDGLMAYAGASSVFGGIPMTEVGIMGGSYDYTNVETQRSYNGKLGAKVTLGDFTFDGHVFRTRIDNAHNLTSSTRSNHINLESEGVNITARYDYDNGFVRGGFNKSKLRGNSDVISSGSESYYGVLLGDSFNLEVHHEFPKWGVRVGSTNEYVLENDDTVALYGEALNSYFVSNLYAEWRPDWMAGLKLRADVNNLFDKEYVDRANIGQYSTQSTAIVPYNEPGRTLLLSAKLEF